MRSKVAIAGHPLHPMLVPLPIGLLFGAVIADFAYLLTDKDMMWYDIAFWALIGGVVTALIAAVAGFAEFWLMARYTDGRELAIAHMVMNLAVVALFIASIVLRLNNNAVAGASFGAAFALSLVGIVVLAISGWLGGELSYRKHLGVEPDDAQEEEREVRQHLVHR